MRFQINWICLVLLLSTPVFAVEKVRPKLKGEWSRAGHQSRFKVAGDNFVEFGAINPNVPLQMGLIRYPFGASYAVVTFKNGDWREIYSAGENMVAVESFNKEGAFIGDGTIFHRHGAPRRGNNPQAIVVQWGGEDKKGKPALTFYANGTAKAAHHNLSFLWTIGADGLIRSNFAKNYRDFYTFELSDDQQTMKIIDGPVNTSIGDIFHRW